MLRSSPYVVIIVVSLLMEIMRFYLIPEWTLWEHAGAFLFQSATLAFIWLVLRSVNRYFERKLPFDSSIAKRLTIQIIITLILLSPLLLLVNYLTDVFFSHLEFMGPQFKSVAVVVFILVIALINFSFYAAHFFRQWKSSFQEKADLQIRAIQADKERSIIQYEHLKNQVNPHFLFNTLTSLDGLIQTEPALASTFVRHLAKVYRYVLDHSEKEVVTLASEIDFIRHYLSVLDIRYGTALRININVSEAAMDRGIAVVTLQMLIDNAIKHNMVHERDPLHIDIYDQEDFLIVSNPKQPRKQIESSTKKGLQHLQRLYTYLHPLPPVIEQDATVFRIKLPLL